MLESIDIRSHVAVYQQIENHVQFAIASGKLKDGDQLPSVRELSERLNVNPNTVAKAYRDLEVMGLLFTRRGMGVFIKEGVHAQCKSECMTKILSRFHEVIAEANAAGISKKKLSTVLGVSFDLDVDPYGDTPKSVLKIANSK
jgi:GntR family transcriptional regulator